MALNLGLRGVRPRFEEALNLGAVNGGVWLLSDNKFLGRFTGFAPIMREKALVFEKKREDSLSIKKLYVLLRRFSTLVKSERV